MNGVIPLAVGACLLGLPYALVRLVPRTDRCRYRPWASAMLAVAVVAFALSSRLPVAHHCLFVDRWPKTWATENESVADSLCEGRGWSDPFRASTGPTAHVAPVYPLCLAGIYRTFGNRDTVFGSAAQICFSLTLAMLTLLMLPIVAAKLQLPAEVGWSAAILCAWLPAHRRYDVLGSHEQIAFTLALQGMILGLASLREHAWLPRRALRIGLALGFGILIAPNILVVLLLFFAAEVVFAVGERRRVLRTGAIVLACIGAITMPWIVRNCAVFGEFVPVRSNFGLELAIGNRSEATGATYAEGFGEMHPWADRKVARHMQEVGEPAFMREMQRQAMHWIAANPADFVRLTAWRVCLFWFAPNEPCWWHKLGAWIPIPIYQLLGIAALFEIFRLGRSRLPAARLLLCAMFGVGLPYFITHVDARYRMPIIGLSAVLGCNLAYAALRWARPRVRFLAARAISLVPKPAA
jgi:hypothetical protein